MTETMDIIRKVDETLAAEQRLGHARSGFKFTLDERSALTLDGEVGSVAEKRIALERAAAVSGVSGIVDRLHVRPSHPMKDRSIRDHVLQALIRQQAFANIDLLEYTASGLAAFRRAPEDGVGEIIVESHDGVVTLSGSAPSLVHKRLAGVIAWWVLGTCDVVNGLAVEPEEEDGPDRIEEAVRLTLEMDPFVSAAQVKVGVRHRIVRLTGAVASESQRRMAETDAWCVFGVDDVVNEIEVKPF